MGGHLGHGPGTLSHNYQQETRTTAEAHHDVQSDEGAATSTGTTQATNADIHTTNTPSERNNIFCGRGLDSAEQDGHYWPGPKDNINTPPISWDNRNPISTSTTDCTFIPGDRDSCGKGCVYIAPVTGVTERCDDRHGHGFRDCFLSSGGTVGDAVSRCGPGCSYTAPVPAVDEECRPQGGYWFTGKDETRKNEGGAPNSQDTNNGTLDWGIGSLGAGTNNYYTFNECKETCEGTPGCKAVSWKDVDNTNGYCYHHTGDMTGETTETGYTCWINTSPIQYDGVLEDNEGDTRSTNALSIKNHCDIESFRSLGEGEISSVTGRAPMSCKTSEKGWDVSQNLVDTSSGGGGGQVNPICYDINNQERTDITWGGIANYNRCVELHGVCIDNENKIMLDHRRDIAGWETGDPKIYCERMGNIWIDGGRWLVSPEEYNDGDGINRPTSCSIVCGEGDSSTSNDHNPPNSLICKSSGDQVDDTFQTFNVDGNFLMPSLKGKYTRTNKKCNGKPVFQKSTGDKNYQYLFSSEDTRWPNQWVISISDEDIDGVCNLSNSIIVGSDPDDDQDCINDPSQCSGRWYNIRWDGTTLDWAPEGSISVTKGEEWQSTGNGIWARIEDIGSDSELTELNYVNKINNNPIINPFKCGDVCHHSWSQDGLKPNTCQIEGQTCVPTPDSSGNQHHTCNCEPGRKIVAPIECDFTHGDPKTCPQGCTYTAGVAAREGSCSGQLGRGGASCASEYRDLGHCPSPCVHERGSPEVPDSCLLDESIICGCIAGKYSSFNPDDYISSCINCASGKWSDTVGADSESTCQDCPIGKFTHGAGAASESGCINCPAHYTRDSSCTSEGVAPDRGGLCYEHNADITTCTDQNDAGGNTCVFTPPTASCRPCQGWEYAIPGTEDIGPTCRYRECTCPNGEPVDPGRCVADTLETVTRVECKPTGCDPGYHFNDATKTCDENICTCRSGQWTAGEGKKGVDCPTDGENKCDSCHPGNYMEIDQCKPCTPQDTGCSVSSNTHCLGGDQRTKLQCITAEVGYYLNNGIAEPCTRQTGCSTDGVSCSTVEGLRDKLICTEGIPTNSDTENPRGYYVDGRGTPQECALGTDNTIGSSASGCAAIECAENEYVSSNVCTACPSGKERDAGDDASGGDTECGTTYCGANKYVSGHVCTSCPTGKTNASGDDATGDDTECDITYCAENEYVSSNVCTPCPAGKTNAAGDNASGMDTECDEQCSTSFICEDISKGVDTTKKCNGTCYQDDPYDQGSCCSITKASCTSFNTSFVCPPGTLINLNNYCRIDQCNSDDYLNCCNIDYTNLDQQTFGSTIESLNLYIISRVIYEDYDISSIPEGSQERAQFEEEFITALRTALNDDTIVININSITGGSIIIDFTINTDSTNVEDTRRNMNTIMNNMNMLSVNLNGEQATPTIIDTPRIINHDPLSDITLPVNGHLVRFAYTRGDGSNIQYEQTDGLENVEVLITADPEMIIEFVTIKTGTPTPEVYTSTQNNIRFEGIAESIPSYKKEDGSYWSNLKIDYYARAVCPTTSTTCNQNCLVTWSTCTDKCETKEKRRYTIQVPQSGVGATCPYPKATDCKNREGKCKSSNDGGFIKYAIISFVVFMILVIGILLLSSSGGGMPLPPMFPPPMVPPTVKV